MAGDHKQIPKSVLRGFCDKGKKVYTMDIDKNIEHKLISDVNAEIGYYDEYVEKQVLKTREDSFGRIKKAINSFMKGKGIVELSKKNNDIIIEYFLLTVFRSEEIMHEMKKKSKTIPSIDRSLQNIVFSVYERCITDVKQALPNLSFNILQNLTSVDFVIPQKQFYHCIQEGGTVQYIMPISPRLAITLNTDIEKFIVDNKVIIQKILKDDFVDTLNIMAIRDEFNNNKKMVFAEKRETLDRYIDCC